MHHGSYLLFLLLCLVPLSFPGNPNLNEHADEDTVNPFFVSLCSMNDCAYFRDEETLCGSEDEDETGRHVMMSHLNLVDLAGSEKAGQTGAEGAR